MRVEKYGETKDRADNLWQVYILVITPPAHYFPGSPI